jgi:hypothetical protein
MPPPAPARVNFYSLLSDPDRPVDYGSGITAGPSLNPNVGFRVVSVPLIWDESVQSSPYTSHIAQLESILYTRQTI